ncbi:hypothetical protein O181_107620 [Austropuccinia psidii MF-1]|uniref:Uncharacterized protein n=1 Tax=Austropuccinia psidii MF-1 TaxID=1389203 RepID=A0A9Q3PNT8_9BASI|nr:hypothetical protein [Austropuccinia psidii MF-1]
MEADELYSYSPLLHKGKFAGIHHTYASKPRMGHTSSSREKIVDDEDKNMSPTQSETNDEPSGDNLTAHEQDTQSNIEFTHPQMSLAQSMLNQSKMRQQRNQAFKAHNVVKHASQKEQQRLLKWNLQKISMGCDKLYMPSACSYSKEGIRIFPHYHNHPEQKIGKFQLKWLVILYMSPRMFSMSHQARFSLRVSKATAKMSSTS